MNNEIPEQFAVGRDVSTWPLMKVAQAGAHAASLRARIGLWISAQPVTVKADLRDDRLGATWTSSVPAAPPTMEWSLCVGDCVHQLRSALDACVWEFATQDGRVPPRPNRVQFPIVVEEEQWAAAARDQLQTVPDVIVERIRAVQPFNRAPEERQTDGLRILQSLSNQDKHRSNIRAEVAIDELAHHMSMKFADEEASSRNVPPDITLYASDLNDGAVLAELRTVDPIESLSGAWNFKLHLTMETSAGALPLFQSLEGLSTFVTGILAGVYNGWDRPAQPADEWVPYDPTIVRPPRAPDVPASPNARTASAGHQRHP